MHYAFNLSTFLKYIHHQHGFRQYRSTFNCLHDIKAEIYESFKKEHVLSLVSLDIAKAYDTAWRPHILQKLQNILCNGKMLNLIDSFFTDRTFSVKVNGHISPQFQQENGVLQGSTLSVTLFLIAINSITETIKFPIKCTLFADDFNFFCSGNNPLCTQSFLQETIKSLHDWSYKTGFTFSVEKSLCISFSRKKKIPIGISLTIGDTVIQNKKSLKILGVIFDTKNTWANHIKTLRK